MQNKKESLIESLSTVAIGYTVAVFSQLLVFPIFNIHVSLTDNFLIALYFTFISVIRVYVVRRWFNRRSNAN